jgi:hypothetical protein
VKSNTLLRKAVRDFYAWVGALGLAAAAPVAASHLVESRAPGWRAAGVVLGTVGFVPFLIVTARMIRRGDEFVRRLHLVAMAWAFVATLLVITLADWLARAGFCGPPRLSVLWLAIAVLWLACIFAAKVYYERPR